MASLSQFAVRMNRRADRLPRAVNVLVKTLCRAVATTVIEGTPVDTAEARSNWLTSLGTPLQGTIAPYSPYPKFSQANGQGRSETANLSAAVARALPVIEARLPGQTVYIQNNTDHITDLNRGTSQQAPENFVNDAVRAGIRSIAGRTVVI